MNILDIIQDKGSFMWFATGDGLVRYDGYEMKVYHNDMENKNSLSNNFVQTLCEDMNGNLWVGTYGGGINLYNYESEQFVRYMHNPGSDNSLSNDNVCEIYEDKSGYIWIGTYEGGLDKFDPKSNKFTNYRYNPHKPNTLSNNNVYNIFEDREGYLWIATDAGLNRYDATTDKFEVFLNDPNDPGSISSNNIVYTTEDKDGIIWVATYDMGLNRYNKKTGKFERYLHDSHNPKSICSNKLTYLHGDGDGNLWIATEGSGVCIFDRENNDFISYKNNPSDQYSLSLNLVYNICEDTSGNLWFGTFKGGINIYKKGFFKNYYHKADDKQSLSDNIVNDMLEDDEGFIWIGTADGGLNRFDKRTETFISYNHDPKNAESILSGEISSICMDANGDLWLGSWGSGIDRFEKKTGKFYHYKNDPNNPKSLGDNYVASMFIDTDGIMWIGGGYSGLIRFDIIKEEFTMYYYDPENPDGKGTGIIRAITEDTDGFLWMTLDGGGLCRMEKRTGNFKNFKNDSDNIGSISGNNCSDILMDSKGNLWVGTWGAGLNLFDKKTGQFSVLKSKDGLPNNMIYGIVEDDFGSLWISTNKGISNFNPQTLSFENYGPSHGLLTNEFNFRSRLASKNGEIYFGNIKGITCFKPGSAILNYHVPEIVITGFKKFDKAVNINHVLKYNKTIDLAYYDNFISFEFAALDYKNPSKNKYAYKLEGIDSEWVYSGTRRYAAYTNLPGGRYIFRVKGSNNDGIWNEEGICIAIHVADPPWKTWWAYLLYMFLGLAAVYCIMRYFLKKHIEKYDALLNNFSISMSFIMNPKEIFDILLKTLEKISKYNYGIALSKEDDYFKIESSRGIDDQEILHEQLRRWHNPLARDKYIKAALETKLPVKHTIMKEEPEIWNFYKLSNIKSVLYVPVVYNNDVLAVIILLSKSKDTFLYRKQELLFSFARQASLALNSNFLYKKLIDVFENMGQVIFTFSKNLRLDPQYSKFANKVFGKRSFEGECIMDILFPFDGYSEKDSLTSWLNMAFEKCNSIEKWDEIEACQPVKEIELINKDGFGDSVKYISIRFYPIMDQIIFSSEEKSVKRLMVIIEDIGEYKRLMTELNDKNNELTGANKELLSMYERLSEYMNVLEELTLYKERTRIAREVHDTLGHTLTIITALLTIGKNFIDKNVEYAVEKIDKAIEMVHNGLSDIRNSIKGLTSDGNENEDIIDSIEKLIKYSILPDTHINLSFNGKETLESIKNSKNYSKLVSVTRKICREAITNAVRHGKAKKIDITINVLKYKMEIHIVDDGIGSKEFKKGFGLISMESRIKEFNGYLTFESDAEQGFIIHIELPIETYFEHYVDK